jgi:hypothetical protein
MSLETEPDFGASSVLSNWVNLAKFIKPCRPQSSHDSTIVSMIWGRIMMAYKLLLDFIKH